MKLRWIGLTAAAGVGLVTAQAVLARKRALILEPPAPRAGSFGDHASPPLHLAVIGDSTAVGIGASSIEQTYPWLLAGYLSDRYRVTLSVFGRGGARMSDAANEFVADAVATSPDLAIIGIGANDVTHVTPLPRFGKALAKSIDMLQTAGVKVLVALGPRFDAPALPNALRAIAQWRARALNRTIRRVAARKKVEVLDLPGRLGKTFAGNRDLYSADGFHPGDDGYRSWSEAMKEQVMQTAIEIGRS